MIEIKKNKIIFYVLILATQLLFSQIKVTNSNNFNNQKEILNSNYVEFGMDNLTNEVLLGKITLINFWYESCAPCIAEMDGLNVLYELNKNNKNFQFISFCTDDIKIISKNIDKFCIIYNVIPIEKSKAYELNYNSGFPTTIIIDANGKVVYYSQGGPIDVKKATEKVMLVYDKILSDMLEKNN